MCYAFFIMKAITTLSVAQRIAVYFDNNPSLEVVRSGAPLAHYYAGQRPGAVGPTSASVRSMTSWEEALYALLCAAGSVSMRDLRSRWGANGMNAASKLSRRGLAERRGTTWHLAGAVA